LHVLLAVGEIIILLLHLMHGFQSNLPSCHIYFACEWTFLKRFSRSEVIGQRYSEGAIALCRQGIHFDGVAFTLTRLHS